VQPHKKRMERVSAAPGCYAGRRMRWPANSEMRSVSKRARWKVLHPQRVYLAEEGMGRREEKKAKVLERPNGDDATFMLVAGTLYGRRRWRAPNPCLSWRRKDSRCVRFKGAGKPDKAART
jgi:hypothetical protein